MKKSVFVILCFVSATSFAQLKLGIQAGFNVAQFADQGSNQQYYHLSNINAFQAGVVAEQQISKHFFFETGLSFIQKGGYKAPTDFVTSGSTTTTKINYLQLPLNLAYKTGLGKNIKLLIGSGIYIAAGVSGSEKGTDNTLGTNTTVDNKVHFTNSSAYTSNSTSVKPFDFGFNANTGIEWKKIQLLANYSHGFGNIYPVGSTKFSNQTFGISIAYLLPWK